MYTLSRILTRSRVFFGERPAVIDGDAQWTYAQLGERVDRLAGALRGLGLRQGDRVAILDINSHRYLESYYACAQAGLVFIPLNSRLAPRELDHVMKDSGARALLFSEPFMGLYESVRRGTPELEFAIGLNLKSCPSGVKDYESLLGAATPRPLTEPAALDDIVLIYYTSGTTGEPKGVCLTNRNMYTGAIDPLTFLGITCNDVWLHAGPMFHLADAWAVWSFPLIGGLQITQPFEPKTTIATIQKAGVTCTALPGSILAMVANMPEAKQVDFSRLKTIVFGGSPTPMGVLQVAATVFPQALTHVYGLTETAGFCTTLLPAEHIFTGAPEAIARTASAGQAVPFMDVRIVDDHGRECRTGEIGEILCAGPQIFKEYWRKPEATASALRDGWYHTGDMGYLDDRQYLFIVDRKKDMIISGGENVYSVEIESVISTHPAVLEVAIIGVPDEKWGEAVKAIVVKRAGASVESEEIMTYCRGKISGYKIPKSVDFSTEPLPKTGSGKISKRQLRDPYWAKTGRRI